MKRILNKKFLFIKVNTFVRLNIAIYKLIKKYNEMFLLPNVIFKLNQSFPDGRSIGRREHIEWPAKFVERFFL